jgi:tetratricopeptide (TPR) repeat protein
MRQKLSWKSVSSSIIGLARVIPALWKGFSSFFLTVVAVGAIVLFVVLVVNDVKLSSIEIADISVPNDLAERGYTPAVAALRFRDALERYKQEANTSMRGAQLDLPGEQPVVVVPTLGLPLNIVADNAALLFGIGGDKRVSGEFTESRNTLWLRLRLNNQVIVDNTKVVTQRAISLVDADALFTRAAQNLFEKTQPYVVAAHLFSQDRMKLAAQEARAIIGSDRPPMDENITMSHLLLGLIDIRERKYGEALAESEAVIKLHPNDFLAHKIQAVAYVGERERAQAIKEIQIASKLNTKDASTHNQRNLPYRHHTESYPIQTGPP